MTRRVVVTGLGATTPLGADVESTWAALIAGKSGVRLLTEDWRELLLCTSPLVFTQNLQIRWSALRCAALIALNSSLSLHP